ncbi:MAG: hypothetical protein NXI04_02090 [Planctomycetaceae bacterium]|nr:hypothetical protein [Planctomycetaceae bacterium]
MTNLTDVDAFRSAAADYLQAVDEFVAAMQKGDAARQESCHNAWRVKQAEMVRRAHVLPAVNMLLQAIAEHNTAVVGMWVRVSKSANPAYSQARSSSGENFSPTEAIWLDYISDSKDPRLRLELLAGLAAPDAAS